MRLLEAPARGFTTRFAPAPTGHLHLGHVANAIAVWGLARAFSGRVLVRIEDHDGTRARPEYEASILEDLEWLGFLGDGPITRQSERGALYEAAFADLESRGLVYACACSRKDIEAVVGTHEGELRYPGSCRTRSIDPALTPARRVRIDVGAISFRDLRLGDVEQHPAQDCGDVMIRDRNGNWTYQFAVSVDDQDQGVDFVIRGEDLLSSTGRQIQIGRLIGRDTPPRFLHHPLILRADGHKLSKSNRDTGIRDLRAAGWPVERVLGAAAASLGLTAGEPVDQAEIVARIGRLID